MHKSLVILFASLLTLAAAAPISGDVVEARANQDDSLAMIAAKRTLLTPQRIPILPPPPASRSGSVATAPPRPPQVIRPPPPASRSAEPAATAPPRVPLVIRPPPPPASSTDPETTASSLEPQVTSTEEGDTSPNRREVKGELISSSSLDGDGGNDGGDASPPTTIPPKGAPLVLQPVTSTPSQLSASSVFSATSSSSLAPPAIPTAKGAHSPVRRAKGASNGFPPLVRPNGRVNGNGATSPNQRRAKGAANGFPQSLPPLPTVQSTSHLSPHPSLGTALTEGPVTITVTQVIPTGTSETAPSGDDDGSNDDGGSNDNGDDGAIDSSTSPPVPTTTPPNVMLGF